MVKFAQLPKYEAYKDSGVEWLGEIPTEWSVLANKHIFKLKKNLVGKRSKEYVLLSLTLKGIIKRDMENPEGKFPAEFDTYQEVNEGDFVFCLFDVEETPRTVGLSPYYGMITGAYTVFETAPEFDKRFIYYFYLNLDEKKRLKPLYTGLRNTISKDAFLSFKTFVPRREEQTLIANFLDQKTSQIDGAIAIKEQQIELLKERKQIIIQQAVTQGLDPNVPMKDSGVEWIGQIPEHWEVVKLSYVAKIDAGSTPSRSNSSYWGGNIPWIKTGEVNYNTIFGSEECITTAGLKGSSLRLAPIGTLLMAMYGQGVTRGRVAVLGIPATYNQACCGITFKSRINVEFARFFFIAAYNYIRDDGNETSQMNLSAGYISSLRIVVPGLDEQSIIIKFLDDFSLSVDEAVSLQVKQIQKLKEYKTTLINSAVTGKIKITPEMLQA